MYLTKDQYEANMVFKIHQYCPSGSYLLFCILFAITAAGVVPWGGPKKPPRTSSIVQFILILSVL